MARRVNSKFLIVLFSVLLLIIAAGAALFLKTRHPPEYYIAKGDKAKAEGDYNTAISEYGKAITKDRGRTELYVKIGDLYNQMVVQDRAYLGKAHGMWQAAEEIDPTYKPALDRLLLLEIDQVKYGYTDPQLFNELRTTAELKHRVDPTDEQAASYTHIATLHQWMFGAAFPTGEVDQHIKALDELARQDPSNVDAAYYASVAQLKRARNYKLDQRQDKAEALFDQVAARHIAQSQARPRDAAVQMRAYQALSLVHDLDDRTERKSAYDQVRGRTIMAAKAAVKIDDDVYDDVQHYYCIFLMLEGKPRAEVERAYRDWAAAKPTDYRARLELADFLGGDRKQRPDAIRLLASPMPPDPNLKGFAALRVKGYERAALIILNTFRAEDARAATGNDRQAMLHQIDSDLEKIGSMGFGEDFALVKLRGKAEMLHNDPVAAVKTFERAHSLIGGGFEQDLLFNLENAYTVTGQTGSAEGVMNELVNHAPDYAPTRIQLAELYLNHGQADQAVAQIQKLEELSEKQPNLKEEVARLRVAMLGMQKQADEARTELSKLPEKDRVQRLNKGQLAAASGDSAEAGRLFRLVLKDDPADPDAVRELVALDIRDGHKEQAQQIVTNALKKQPDNAAFAKLRDRLAITTPQQMLKWQDEEADKIPDSFQRTLRKAQLAMARGISDPTQFETARGLLDAADKIKPNDARTVDLRYQWYLRQGKLDEAAPFVEQAARAGLDGLGGFGLRTRYALDRRDAADAIRWASQLIGRYREFAENWVLYGQAHQLAGQYREAADNFTEALNRQPDNLEAMRRKAQCLDAMGQFDDERRVIEQASRLAGDNPVIRDLSLNFELHHGDAEKVIKTCEDLIQQDPANPVLYAALGQACQATARIKYAGDPAKYNQMLIRSRDTLSSGLQRFGNTSEARRFYAPLAMTLEYLGDAAGAEKLLKEFVNRPDQKDLPDASRELARFYDRANRLPEADHAWRDAYAKSNHSVDLELERASSLMRHQRIDDALRVLEDNPTDPRVVAQRIQAMLTAQRFVDARKLVDQVIASDPPDDSTPRYYRGVIELAQGEPDAAWKDFLLLRDRDPQNIQYRLWLARALRIRGNRDDAITELGAALKIAPTRPDIRLALLDAYSSGNPPRWEEFDLTVQNAIADPVLGADMSWRRVLARGLAKRGLFDRALAEVQVALKADPTDYSTREDYVNILVQSHNWQAVLKETDKELSEGHNEGFLYGKRGVARSQLRDRAGSLQEFDAGLAADVEAKDLDGIADILRTIAEVISPDEALARLDKYPAGAGREILTIEMAIMKHDAASEVKGGQAVLAAPDVKHDQKVLAYRAIAEGYIGLKDYPKARDAWDELLRLRPNDLVVLNNLAYLVAEEMNQPVEAKRYSQQAYNLVIRTGGAVRDVFDTHGWVLTLCGGHDAQQGLQILENLKDNNKTFIRGRLHLARSYIRQVPPKPLQANQELSFVQDEVQKMEEKHLTVDPDLKEGIKKAQSEIRQVSAAGR